MALHNVWIATASDGLVRADQIVGIGTHQTPRLAGKPAHWLFYVNVAVPAGSGTPGGWDVGILNRTIVQCSQQPTEAPVQLAQLLSHLDATGAAGLVEARYSGPRGNGGDTAEVDLGFTPFPVLAAQSRIHAVQPQPPADRT
ncbi:hypothetical protein [Pseudonocardia acidicola]|uniref:hypothetical protein n=1 Tax=Pseudonocardia acidicola TaxID=2724939 RepID=UPI001B7CFDF8|nr:hypothetical protein [Pseudonocardia acidicola]